MSDLSREQVAHLASLARIAMSEDELDRMAQELDVIVEAVASVQEVATDDVPVTSHPIPLTNVLREDAVVPTLTQDQALRNAPDAEDGQFKVPAILSED